MPLERIESSKAPSVSSGGAGRLAAICAVLVALVFGCRNTETYPLHPSYAELAQRGFYIYVLPESEMNQRRWSQTVWIYFWDQHCKNPGPSASPNPISVNYDGPDGESQFSLLISPWSITWQHDKRATEVPLKTPWADGAAEYYRCAQSCLRFVDWLGVSVEVWSSLPVTDTVGLVNQLQYIGPPRETLTSPWDYSRCEE